MTALWTAADVADATGGRVVGACADASGVSIDTRSLRPGDLFVALIGETGRDGHDHAEAAHGAGAAFALSHRDLTVPHVRVSDTFLALRALGKAGRERATARVVAVTGSVGKTTVKEMLRALLSTAGPTHAAEASYNNQWGVPLTLARLSPAAVFCVVEIGMNHAGEIAPLARLAQPHVALVTNVERVHIGHLGTLQAIADEKASIFEGLLPDGVAIVPEDSDFRDRLMCAGTGRIYRFGYGPGSNARPAVTELGPNGSEVNFQLPDGPLHLQLSVAGEHMVVNAAAALLAAWALGIDVARAAPALETFGAVAGRGARRRVATPDGGFALLIDESYNASPVSVRAALAVLAVQPHRRRVAVLGDMLELGDDEPTNHTALAPHVAADAVFACGPLMAHLVDALGHGTHAPDSRALAPIVAAALRDGDVVLVKGSLGSRMRVVVDALVDAPALAVG